MWTSKVVRAGRQLTSKRATSARAMFGQGTREDRNKLYMDPELEKCSCGRGTPGPVYKHLLGLGKQPLSTAPMAPSAHFGTAKRFSTDAKHPLHSSPGAGQYAANKSALGKQVYSKKKTLPSYGFGSSTRDGARHVCPMILRKHALPEEGCRAASGDCCCLTCDCAGVYICRTRERKLWRRDTWPNDWAAQICVPEAG
jgi:hypothetical protein